MSLVCSVLYLTIPIISRQFQKRTKRAKTVESFFHIDDIDDAKSKQKIIIQFIESNDNRLLSLIEKVVEKKSRKKRWTMKYSSK